MEIKSQYYKNISYKLINNGSKQIIIILPKAAANFEDHQDLINLLTNKSDILFIETGYFGISKTEKDDPNLSTEGFNKSLHELLSQWNYQEIIFLAESVGANHALVFTQQYPEKVIKLILSNPALYQPKWYHFIFSSLLLAGQKISPNKLLQLMISVCKRLPSEQLKRLSLNFEKMDKTVGALSYLLCLKEIVKFGKSYKKKNFEILFNKIIVVSGQEDKVFELLCNKSFCQNCFSYQRIPSAGHGIFKYKPETAYNAIYSQIK